MYNTDGTGRDGYVTHGNGGFTNPAKQVALDPRVAFQRSLRGYEPDGDYLNRRKRYAQKRRMYSNATTTLADEPLLSPKAVYQNETSGQFSMKGDRKSVDMIISKQTEVGQGKPRNSYFNSIERDSILSDTGVTGKVGHATTYGQGFGSNM